jgi:hypothetical protein
MKKFTSIFLLFLFYFQASADVGPVYCFKANIKLKSGIEMTGYFKFYNISIGTDDEGFFFFDGTKMRFRVKEKDGALILGANEYHFSNEVKRRLSEIEMYPDVRLLTLHVNQNYNSIVAIFIGKGTKLKSEQIQDLTVHAIYMLDPTANIETKLLESDKTWITEQPTLIDDANGIELCSYKAICFDADRERSLNELRHLKNLIKKYNDDVINHQPWDQKKSDAIWSDIIKEIERLRLFHILIRSSCSC